jgi:putative membrane protein insertion efficiency factor
MSKVLIFLIRIYQMSRPFRRDACRFYPSCSSYATACLEKHGFFHGTALTIWRVLRCQPFCRGGVDEVPEVVNINFNFGLDLFRSIISKRV